MLPSEDSYGLPKRFEFVVAEIDRRKPRRVLDFGCGTGANLTVLLAERYPHIQFIGVDSDEASIAHARRTCGLRNLEFRLYPREFTFDEDFDVIVASEVLEHVEEPDTFLTTLRGSLTPGGALLITVPNGYGPYELGSMAATLLQLSGLYALLRKLKQKLSRTPNLNQVQVDTLAISPHVNFFSFGELRRLFDTRGLEMVGYRSRTFLCGFGFDQLLRGTDALRWNARVADRMPPQIVSDWMFVLVPSQTPVEGRFRRGTYARLRRWLNYRRYGLHDQTISS
jgi:SAM-dependent methyltransferase